MEHTNYYGDLCTEVYEILHPSAPAEEWEFYRSYAKPGDRILEPLCGSGRFLIPFLEEGFDIEGVDLSAEMLDALKRKAPAAKALWMDLMDYTPQRLFDYIFICSGSIGLFTDLSMCRKLLVKLRSMLRPGGRFVFSVDTVDARSPEDTDYCTTARMPASGGTELVLLTKNHYDPQTQTQFSPGIYQRWKDGSLVQTETMDFLIHLYRPGEMESYLKDAGFSQITTYSSFCKEPVSAQGQEILLFECTV